MLIKRGGNSDPFLLYFFVKIFLAGFCGFIFLVSPLLWGESPILDVSAISNEERPELDLL